MTDKEMRLAKAVLAAAVDVCNARADAMLEKSREPGIGGYALNHAQFSATASEDCAALIKRIDLSAIVASVQSEQHPTPQPAQTDKALQLCREHAELVGAIKPMARQIGEALSECPKEKKYGGNNNHLTDWFKENRYDAPDEYFGDDEPCENCWKAYLLIRDRKKLRSQLRIVRMRITKLGKSATP